ncbi:hypothetical protein [Fictibacillus terranigra]|uniref:Group-specific protein n=1 Tax=Fictibacillus terranigra TaxID=3058424 RepID=A0ABT8EBR3_9BACL|nr:hypothetical protein [Fictibacillus sp. CENA-BCM004]MDN4075368.1 hypothetical protein [Fictibacillus sp. CENA-BCM004]
MSKCNMDHSTVDVKHKYEAQKEELPDDICALFDDFLNRNNSQTTLNEMFHLLKKYDLADELERLERNRNMRSLLLE